MSRTLNQRSERLRLLLALLQWEGEIRSSRVQQLLSVTAVPASRLISQFRDAYPGLTVNDTRQKRWVLSRAAGAKKELEAIAPSIDEYLVLIGEDEVTAKWLVDGRQTFLDPNPIVLSTLRTACLSSLGVTITYASMNHPEGTRRTICPHAIVRGSQRWHTRAWCEERQEYRDFALGRITAPALLAGEGKDLPPDQAWEKMIEVRVGAHSALPMEQEAVIRDEYFQGNVARRFKVRAALLHYLLNDIRAATDPRRQSPPEYLLEVMNLDEIRPYLFSERTRRKRSC